MIGQGSQGWATTLADLSIILFMITAADLSNAELAKSGLETTSAMVATAEPVAMFRPGPSAPTLKAWLSQQPDDPRQQLTVIVRHKGSGAEADAIIARGLDLMTQADAAGRQARLIVEHSDHADVAAILAYDSDPAVAHKLLEHGQRNNTEKLR